jgi:hypothetical protein
MPCQLITTFLLILSFMIINYYRIMTCQLVIVALIGAMAGQLKPADDRRVPCQATVNSISVSADSPGTARCTRGLGRGLVCLLYLWQRFSDLVRYSR